MAYTYPGHPLREVVIGTKTESPEGTWTAPDGNFGTNLYEADFRSEWETYKNQPLKPGLTPGATTIGAKLARPSWTSELGGIGTASGADQTTDDPQWALNTPGMQSSQGTIWTLESSPTGTPFPGERFTGSGDGEIIFFRYVSTTHIVGIKVAGTPATSETYTGEASGATFQLDTADIEETAHSRIHHPDSSYTSKSIGLYHYETGGEAQRIAFRGCRGTWGIQCTRGQTMRLPCEALGAFDPTNSISATAPTVTRDAYSKLGFIGASFLTAWDAGEPSAVFSSINVELGNPMAPRENTNNAEGVQSILHGPGGREPTGSWDPEMGYESGSQELWSSKTAEGTIEWDLGSTAKDIVRVRIGRARITGYDGNDRGPVKALALPFDIAGAGTAEDYEIMIETA